MELVYQLVLEIGYLIPVQKNASLLAINILSNLPTGNVYALKGIRDIPMAHASLSVNFYNTESLTNVNVSPATQKMHLTNVNLSNALQAPRGTTSVKTASHYAK